jgi:hypothetical protein
LDDDSNCEPGVISFPMGTALGEQTVQGLYEITLREEITKIYELTGSITYYQRSKPGFQTRVWRTAWKAL